MMPVSDVVLFTLVAVGGALALRFWSLRRSERERARLVEPGLLAQFARLPANEITWVRIGFLGLGVAALALASGSATSDLQRETVEGAETILVLDASNSMLVEDVEPNRLGVQRRLARSLANRIPGRIGVVYFAGRAYVLSPLTTDLSAVQMFVEGVRPAAVGRGGSSLAAGLTQALDLLAGGEEGARKAIVLLSDGEETVEQPLQDALDRARDNRVTVYTLGIGTANGGQVPLTRDASLDPATALNRRRGPTFLQDSEGRPVISRLEAGNLRTIATQTSGRYLPGIEASVGRLGNELGGSGMGDAASGSALVSVLLLTAFVSLWIEAFLLPRG
jgi:Ca-activated chloride channel family protein